MKRLCYRMFALFFLLITIPGAAISASDPSVLAYPVIGQLFGFEGVWYEIISDNQIAVIKCPETGSITDPSWPTEKVTILSSLKLGGVTYTVTTIKQSAFQDCSELTEITIPPTITSISYDAFFNCNALSRVNIYNLEAWYRISFANQVACPLYYGAHLYCDGQEIVDLIIPETITKINNYTFCGAKWITSVTLHDSVTSIGAAFYNCSELTRINIPDIDSWCNISFKGLYANALCNGARLYCNDVVITDLVIPESVTEIKDYAFTYGYFTSVKFNDNLTSIGYNSFSHCGNLTEVTIPASIQTIKPDAFEYCTQLERVNTPDIDSWCNISFGDIHANPLYYAERLYSNGEEITEVEIPASLTEVKNCTFCNARYLTSVKLHNSITSVGYCSFFRCHSLTSLDLPTSLTTIGDQAFCDCINISETTLPQGLKNIGENSFNNCSNLNEITIPSSVTSIQKYAFYGCDNLKKAVIEDSETPLSTSPYIFSFSGIEDIYIGRNLVQTYAHAFGPNYNLMTVTFGDYVTFISDESFLECHKLVEIKFSNSITSIGKNAFRYCTSLTEIRLPGSLTHIEYNAFDDCDALSKVYYESVEPISGDSNIFSDDIYATATLYMPAEGIEKARGITPWKLFSNIEPYEFSGIDGIEMTELPAGRDDIDYNSPVDVYSINGMLLHHGLRSDACLARGYYIIRQGTSATKIFIK